MDRAGLERKEEEWIEISVVRTNPRKSFCLFEVYWSFIIASGPELSEST